MRALLFSLLMFSGGTAVAASYGEPMPEGEARDIAVVIAENRENEAAEKFSGRITQVCQKEGCWLMIESGGQAARVKTNHAFVVPKNARGQATVYGVLDRVELSAKAAKHLAEEGSAVAAQDEWQIVASAVEITD